MTTYTFEEIVKAMEQLNLAFFENKALTDIDKETRDVIWNVIGDKITEMRPGVRYY